MKRRAYRATIFAVLPLIVVGGCALTIEKMSPVVARPGERVFVWTKNLPEGSRPKLDFAGTPVLITHERKIAANRTLLELRAPSVIGKAPLKITSRGTGFYTFFPWLMRDTSKQSLNIIRSDALRYPADRPYLLHNPYNPLAVTPFGPQKVLVVVGYPTDIAPGFTVADLDADVQSRFATVNTYWSTISQNNVSLAATVYPQMVPLTKKYAEYVNESRPPYVRGAPVTYPIDLSGFTDHNLYIDVTGPDGVVHTASATWDNILPSGTLGNVQWGNAWQIFVNSDGMFPIFIDNGDGTISLELSVYGENVGGTNPTYFYGAGYRVTALRGAAWAAFGMAPGSYNVKDSSGVPMTDPLVGLDTDLQTGWTDELQAAVDASGFSLAGYTSVNYMLVGSPVLAPLDYANLNPIGGSQHHYLRSSAYVGYGWIRLPHDVDWTTWAHETGHNLSLSDEYQETLAQPGAYMNGWTLMADNWYGSHVTAWEKGPRIGEIVGGGHWLPEFTQATPPGPSGNTTTSNVILAPQYDPLPTFPGYSDPVAYAAEFKLSPSHSVLVEGRQDQPVTTPRRFDELLDQIDHNPGNGGVLVYDVRDQASYADWPNVYRREMVLLSPYDDALDSANPTYSDPATGVSVEVLNELGTGSTRSFRVALGWGRANPPSGAQFDAYITPWDSTYQSPDIWVDSPLNGYDTYSATSYTADGDPNGAGDTVAVQEENRLYARIRNLGPQAIPSATVTFWVATPAGIGDRGDWQRLDPVTVGPIPAGGSVRAYTIWIPSGLGHTCVKVEVTPIAGEVAFDNNLAQENFTNFEMPSSSPYKPLNFTFDLFNSSDHPRQFALRAHRRIPWIEVNLDHAFPVVPAKGKVTVKGLIKLNEKVAPGVKSDTPVIITAYAPRHDSEIKVGGLTLYLQPRRASSLDIKLIQENDYLVAFGTLKGGETPRLVTLSVHGEGRSARHAYVRARTDAHGHYRVKIPIESARALTVYAFAPATGEYSAARSQQIRFKKQN